MLLDKHIIMNERFANSDESNNFEISDELLYNLAWGIFGIDDNDPWYFNYDYLKGLCINLNELDKYDIIKAKMSRVMDKIISDKLDYITGQELKYKYVEDEFGKKIIRK
jgi:hypothetical protein